MHISSVIKILFCRISFSGHQNKFCACLDSIYRSRVILVMCKNCSDISWHRLNLNQSKTNCPKNLNSDGLIVREIGPWPECIFRSLLQFLVILIFSWLIWICKLDIHSNVVILIWHSGWHMRNIIEHFGTSAWLSVYIPQSVARCIYLTIQYIPRNMHTVLLCFALLWLCNRS